MSAISKSTYKVVALFPVERADELFILVNDCWNKAHAYYMKSERHDRYGTIDQLKSDMKKSKVLSLMDVESNKIAGSLSFSTTYKTSLCYFGTLCIGKDHQGKGLAEILIKEAERQTYKMKKHQLFILVVDCATKLKAYYAKLGFQSTGHVEKRESSFLECVKPEYQSQVHFQEMVKTLPIRCYL